MQINEEKSALLSLEIMEIKLSMVLSLIMPTPRAVASAEREPCVLPATSSGPAEGRSPPASRASPGGGAWGVRVVHPSFCLFKTQQVMTWGTLAT